MTNERVRFNDALVTRLRMNSDDKTKQAMQQDCQNAADVIEMLEKWIEDEGERGNTCTRNILGRVCSYCNCWMVLAQNKRLTTAGNLLR